MPIHKDISFESQQFQALINNDLVFVSNNFEIYDNLKDYWLTTASCFSDLEMNQLFVSKGANPHFSAEENFTNAIFQNKLDLVQFYVSQGCILLNEDDTHLGGAIMNAISHDNLDMLKYLINIGCNIHIDTDYAFNRGIAENSIRCVSYLIENYQMSYDPNNDYNIQKIIEHNYYQIFNYLLNNIQKPLSFNFNAYLPHLFTHGHPEIFDLFVQYDLINETLFIQHFESLIYYFPNQQKLYEHFSYNYSEWFQKALDKTIEKTRVFSILEFVLSQQYFHDNTSTKLDISYFNIIIKIPFINKVIASQPSIISELLLKNISNKNNLELLECTFQPDYIHEQKIQSILNSILPDMIEKSFFSSLLKLIFKKSFSSQFDTLNKIYSYYKLELLMMKKSSSKRHKI